eukprot:TRINITY_DN224_c0_g1_i14.p3 TRINITY_DN224_c0_g1~~TRINITY_DN224_c0_g1_i14.p3  ORF type:complete len:239 (-),score=112.71 TRINITY_DN224_c0_g1_i14:360-1076(-)
MQLHYFYLEARKSLFKPLLVRWYRRVAANEIYNLEVFYHENIELKVRELIRVTKNQLEYWEIHRDFQDIKAESINLFLANEHLNLQRHIADRALSILKQAQTYEELNKSKYIQTILDDATQEIDKQLKGPNAKEIQRRMLDSAINGLSKGFMDYQNDPILPIVQGVVKRHVEKLAKLSPQEQGKLLALTDYQLQQIRIADKKAKEDFLQTQPSGLESSVKNNEHVKKVLSTWGAQLCH